jgi:endosialidase-like protein
MKNKTHLTHTIVCILFAAASSTFAPLASAGGVGSTVGGGVGNTADGNYATIAGGNNNLAWGDWASIAGGIANVAGNEAAVGGGHQNAANGDEATISGGKWNQAQGYAAVVPGGYSNNAGADYSFAGGNGATTRSAQWANTPGGDAGSFVWADGQTSLTTYGPKQFIVGANGGFGVNTVPINAQVAMTIAATASNPNYASIFLRRAGGNEGILISSGDAIPMQNATAFYIDQYDGFAQTRRLSLDTAGRLTITNQAYKPGGGSWAASSDARLKTNVRPLGHALDQMLALKGVTFEYAHPDSGMHPSGKFSGFIAQEVEKVFPSWIGHDNDGYLTVGPQGFEALTVEALRELKTSEEDRVTKLERDNADLRELVASQTKAISELRREVAAVTNVADLRSRQLASAQNTP